LAVFGLVCLTSGAAQAPVTPKGQWPPARDWPPGWRLYEPYPEELAFVVPQATTKLASEVRTLTDGRALAPSVISSKVLLDIPYLAPGDPFFGYPRRIACLPDGSLAVASTAKFHKEGRFQGNPYASGFWKVAPDGAITAITAKHAIVENSPYYPVCGMPFAKSRVNPEIKPMTLAPDGSLVFPYDGSVLRLTPDGRVEHVPPAPGWCAADKTAAEPFGTPEAAVQDPRGNVWVSDGEQCALWRIAPDGSPTKVLGREQMCPAGDPENWIVGEFLAWDAVHDELVMSGGVISQRPPHVNFYSLIHRVRPDGTPRRVFLGFKVGKRAPRVDGISGLAVDGAGAIYFGAGVVSASGSVQVMRLDESKGMPVVVAGAPAPTGVNHGDGPAGQAHFAPLRSLCVGRDGTIYTAEASNVIRKITSAGQVTTWAF
jgi:hypothetical protein